MTGRVRSGTSLMMRMLEAGGVPVEIDNHKRPDKFNPHGYYETRKVQSLRTGETEWLNGMDGRAVKVLPCPLIRHLPTDRQYLVIRMMRPSRQIAASFHEMLRLGPKAAARRLIRGRNREEWMEDFIHVIDAHQRRVERHMLGHRDAFAWLDVRFEALIENPDHDARRVAGFIGRAFPDLCGNINAMAEAVDPALRHHR